MHTTGAVRTTGNGAWPCRGTPRPRGQRLVHDPEVIADRPGLDKIHARATFGNHTCAGTGTY